MHHPSVSGTTKPQQTAEVGPASIWDMFHRNLGAAPRTSIPRKTARSGHPPAEFTGGCGWSCNKLRRLSVGVRATI